MTISPAQKRAQGWLMKELKKELDSMSDAYANSVYPQAEWLKQQHNGGRSAIAWIREWVADKEKEIA